MPRFLRRLLAIPDYQMQSCAISNVMAAQVPFRSILVWLNTLPVQETSRLRRRKRGIFTRALRGGRANRSGKELL
jgi:hypothetical protein